MNRLNGGVLDNERPYPRSYDAFTHDMEGHTVLASLCPETNDPTAALIEMRKPALEDERPVGT